MHSQDCNSPGLLYERIVVMIGCESHYIVVRDLFRKAYKQTATK